jgi:hypothetical protein
MTVRGSVRASFCDLPDRSYILSRTWRGEDYSTLENALALVNGSHP